MYLILIVIDIILYLDLVYLIKLIKDLKKQINAIEDFCAQILIKLNKLFPRE